MTRLRTVVRDPSKVDKEALAKIKGVLRVAGTDSEPQIVVGPGVADTASEEIKKMPGIKFSVNTGEAMMTKKSATGVFQFFAKVFTPVASSSIARVVFAFAILFMLLVFTPEIAWNMLNIFTSKVVTRSFLRPSSPYL